MSNISESLGGKSHKFKDFTLNTKSLRTTFTDEELEKIFHVTSVLGAGDNPEVESFEMLETPNPFVDAAILQSQRGRTENNAPTFTTSSDARVDFLFHVMEQTLPEQTLDLLSKSWKLEPLDTLKLIAHLRSVKDGKGIRRQYHDCLLWLYKNHPKTLYENLEELLHFGYWKDALQMLLVICFDGFVHQHLSYDDTGSGPAGRVKATKLPEPVTSTTGKKRKWKLTKQHIEEKEAYNKVIADRYFEKPISRGLPKKEMDEYRLRFARDKFSSDLKYRVFHTKIAQVFAKQLKSDMDNMKKSPKPGPEADTSQTGVSLAAKWAPSLEAHFDRYTLIASSIAVELLHLFNDEKITEILSKPLPIAVYLARRNYHKDCCVPLRKFHEIPEINMSNNNWDKINYKRVPSKCMKRNTASFISHDEERFRAFLKKPENKVAGAALKPVEILEKAMNMHSGTPEEEVLTIEKQWVSLCDSIKSKGGGLLKNSLAVCDVSGSMAGMPMTAALGLTLITMNMSEKPWNSVCVTFHDEPTFFNLPPELSLLEKTNSLKLMPWGYNTDIQKVFQLIVDMGLKNKISPADMPQILFIFSDMEFDEACPGTSETNFEAAKTLFASNGYTMPTIVFWNLRASPKKNSTPVQSNELGVLLMSGFSAQSLSYIMEIDDVSKLNPINFVHEIVNKSIFSKLKIYD